ncbi:MAG: LacI family DNA-binding transcriptional regulator [Hyphomicrobiaceae bacterium]|nr:LacI family DNA-binding transcriptional regulator [Hyphomicrobiaceae bacterium]
MATIKDVARQAGVAISTVSAVLNRSAPVSQDVIDRVQAAIAKTGYTPHAAARSLRSGRSRLIGLVVPNIANPHFAMVAREVENVCLRAGYTSMVYSSGQDPRRESQVLTMMRVQRVAGLILIPTRSDAGHGAALIDQINVPTVLLDMQVEGLPFDVVKSDNAAAGRLAAEHLIGLGHKHIGMIVGIPGLATSDDRQLGFTQALAQNGLACDRSWIGRGEFDMEQARTAAKKVLYAAPRPTALVAVSNMTTLGVLLAARDLGLAVPRDLSVVGIDDFEMAALMDPQPTVVSTPVREMARASIERLLDIVDKKNAAPQANRIFEPALIVRSSTSRPPA